MSLSNLSSCLSDCPGTALGQGSCGHRRDPDSRTAVLVVLPKEGGQSCSPCWYPLSPVWDSWGPRTLLHPSPTSLSWCSALHAVGAQ